MEENKRHVQVPYDMTITRTISPKDLLTKCNNIGLSIDEKLN